MQVHPGNTADPSTVPGVIDTVKERFGIERVILVGDRAMITDAHAATLKELGAGFVSALKTAQIRKLIGAGELQLSLFDQTNLAEITTTSSPASGWWCAATRTSPPSAPANARTCWPRPSASSPRSARWSTARAARCIHADAGKIGERAGRVINKYKVAKHFELQIADGSFTYQRKTEQITGEAALDGLYVVRTTCPAEQLTTQAVVRVYKQLKMAERAYRTIKDALDVRPIRHHLEDRVEAHFFLFLLAYYLLFELQARLAPMLFTDDTPTRPDRSRRARPTLPRREHQSRPRPHSRRPARLQPPRPDRRARDRLPQPTTHRRQPHTFPRLTNPNTIQAKALELLNVNLAK